MTLRTALRIVEITLGFVLFAPGTIAIPIALLAMDASYPPYAGAIGRIVLPLFVSLAGNAKMMIVWTLGIVVFAFIHCVTERPYEKPLFGVRRE